ncbi:hypothetical protein O0L34_g1789 [Tuta absoluta]|nr:hypothetical protein O0L34_g1789 [Tuta absoluta]
MRWCVVFACLALVVSAVRAQDYYDEDDWDLPLDEAGEDNEDNRKDGPVNDDAIYDDYSKEENDDINLPDEDSNKLENVASEQKININENLKNDEVNSAPEGENNSYENVPIEDLRMEDKRTDQLVQEQINQVQEDLDEPNSAISDDFNDYQVEDNRSDKEDIPSKLVENNLPSDVHESFEVKDKNAAIENDPSDSFDMGMNYPEFGRDSDNIAIDKEDSPDMHQIIADANKLLNEENGIFEEDTESKNPDDSLSLINTNDEVQDPSSKEDEYDNFARNKLLIDELPQVSRDQEDGLEKLSEKSSLEDTVEINIGQDSAKQEIQNEESLGDLAKNSQEESDFENVHGKVDLALKEENEPRFSFVNDMIDPKEFGEALKDSNDESNSNDDQNNKGIVPSDYEDEDTVDKVYKDLNDDLEKLFATLNKLTSDDTSNELEKNEKISDEHSEGDVVPNKDKHEDYSIKEDDLDKEETVLKDREALDKYIDQFGADDVDSIEDSIDSNEYYNDENIFAADTDVDVSNVQEVAKKSDETVLENRIESSETSPVEAEKEAVQDDILSQDDSLTQDTTVKSIAVTDLSSEQYNDLMTQFSIVHASELDTQAENFGKYIAAVHMTLSAEEAIEITSPNFPSTYPTNNVLDWILEGDGTGIELNITDLAVRGAQGDFLLVKPGGLDESGPEGLIFSYTLNEPRLYRFTDVSRVFVRFQSGPGLGFLKGFRMTVKNIWPADNFEEDLPEPETLLPSPTATFTVNLDGITVFDFSNVKSDFQRIIADMATMYINANGIDAGLNSTSETAQITSVSSCKASWPNFENCVAVTFGVPLVYEEEDDERTSSRLNETDLSDMWKTSVDRDPFAARLRAIGISEFGAPDDNHVMLIWMVLAVGIVISATLVAFTLWRYSCFEDYTRMKSYSDTDSVFDQKRGLDLYPTPHQTLPPLYAEQDYKWADASEDSTRVDMGGFANRSFTRDELVDIYSDEDAAVKRDRFTTDV